MNRAERLCVTQSKLAVMVSSLALFATNGAFADEYYVATTGSDSNPGTQASPFATITKAASVAAAGDTVFIRGGTYTPSSGTTFSKSGTSDTNRIKFWAYPGEKPIFDYSKAGGIGFNVTGSWLHFKGIEICYAGEPIVISNASNDIMELMDTHHAEGSGIFISHGRGGHLLLNCDSHDNYDKNGRQGDGQNADGFGVHYQAAGDGTRTIIRGCRAWWNSDDGYDFINQEVPVTIENSMAFGNGYVDYGTGRPGEGNGNGFKIGSSKTGIRHLVQNNIAWGNRAAGFYANHSSGGNTWYNNTAFQNGTAFNMLASTWSEPNGKGTRTDGVHLTGALAHIMRNNIAFPNKNSYIDGYGVDSQFNTWDLNITPANKDFASLTDATIGGTGQVVETTSLALGPRQADGSPPKIDFLRLAAGSAMIDKGKDVGLPFVGAAPDLGAYEFGVTSATGGSNAMGGASAAGGSKAMGGAPNTGGAMVGGSKATGGAVSGGVGGNVSTGGNVTKGGSAAVGGDIATTGGRQNMGGFASTGGAMSATGVLVANGGEDTTGGSLAASGNGAVGGSRSSDTSGIEVGSEGLQDSGGCSCRLPGTRVARAGVASGVMLLSVAFVNLRRRRRGPRRESSSK